MCTYIYMHIMYNICICIEKCMLWGRDKDFGRVKADLCFVYILKFIDSENI